MTLSPVHAGSTAPAVCVFKCRAKDEHSLLSSEFSTSFLTVVSYGALPAVLQATLTLTWPVKKVDWKATRQAKTSLLLLFV